MLGSSFIGFLLFKWFFVFICFSNPWYPQVRLLKKCQGYYKYILTHGPYIGWGHLKALTKSSKPTANQWPWGLCPVGCPASRQTDQHCHPSGHRISPAKNEIPYHTTLKSSVLFNTPEEGKKLDLRHFNRCVCEQLYRALESRMETDSWLDLKF